MALFRVRCSGCRTALARIRGTSAEATAEPCGGCGKKVVREAQGPSSTKMECLDNGAMAKSVERFADAERLYKERADQADSLSGGYRNPLTK
jgi:hypothetical protein